MALSDERKNGIRHAMQKFIDKQTEMKAPAKKNNDPERQFVRDVLMPWYEANGWDMQIAEAKSKLVNGVWTNAGIDPGTPDTFGNTPDGLAAFIEAKAPGKRSTFWKNGNEKQQLFIYNKIDKNAFAVVVDNVTDLENWYALWLRARDQSANIAKAYLFDLLPRKPKRGVDDSSLFD